MIYGLYLSAAGVVTNSYRQDVIANNIANAETPGFKRDLALFQQRLTEAQERRGGSTSWSDPLLEKLGGGVLASPTLVDQCQGELEPTGGALDVGVEGDGFFAVDDNGKTRLTRDGQFAIDRAGRLTLSDAQGQPVLGADRQPIVLKYGSPASIDKAGIITQHGKPVGRLGLFDVADRTQMRKEGGTLLSFGSQPLAPAPGILRSEFVERANVDPATELATLMQTQRELEANANMIRYQDQTLQRLVNEVGKIG